MADYNLNSYVLILGAGASKAINSKFGLGKDLLTDIYNSVDDLMIPIWKELEKPIDLDIVKEFKRHLGVYIASYNEGSIDHFISEIEEFPEYQHNRFDFIRIAKYSILFHILGYEGKLKEEFGDINFNSIKGTWIEHLVEKIIELKRKNTLNKLKIITFNYDRVVEHFLNSIFPYEEEVKNLILTQIFHVYGYVNGIKEVEFGFSNRDIALLSIDKFSTIYSQRFGLPNISNEQIDKNDFKYRGSICRTILGTCSDTEKEIHRNEYNENLYFMKIGIIGFSFDDLNSKLLNLSHKYENSPIFSVNIYTPPFDLLFEMRRENTLKCRRIRSDFNFYYTSPQDFLVEFFNS